MRQKRVEAERGVMTTALGLDSSGGLPSNVKGFIGTDHVPKRRQPRAGEALPRRPTQLPISRDGVAAHLLDLCGNGWLDGWGPG